jgi:pilus assembly protein Flp/PilA
MKNLLKRLWIEDEGQDLTEYALLLALIALGAITAMKSLATTINAVFQNAATNLTSATGTGG